MKTVNSIQELCDSVISSLNTHNAIIIEDFETSFEIDFREILRECDICHFEDEDTLCIVKYPVHISNIVAPKLSFVNILFYEDVYVGGIDNCNITDVYFCSCKFLAEKKYSSILHICDCLQMTDCYSKSSICINSIKEAQSISIEDLTCDKNLEFWNLKLASSNFSKKAEAYIHGDVKNKVLFFHCFIVNGDITINCDCRKLDFFGVNYNFEEKRFLDVSFGTILTSGVEIGLLNLYYCKVHTIGIHNTIVSNIHEYQFFYENLEDETSMTFRNAALQNNNDILRKLVLRL